MAEEGNSKGFRLLLLLFLLVLAGVIVGARAFERLTARPPRYAPCPVCGHRVLEDLSPCPHCGQALVWRVPEAVQQEFSFKP